MKTLMRIIMLAAILLVAVSAQAQTSTKITYTEQYRYHGFSLYGDNFVHTGVSTTIRDVDISVISHADDAEMDDFEYWDTSIAYGLPDIAGMKLTAGYNYLILPTMDVQEASITASIPGTISPRYTFSYVIPEKADLDGKIHVLGVDVDLGDPEAVSAVLKADITYNDGFNPVGGQIIHDWSHVTAGLLINIPIGEKVALQPVVLYQLTLDESVNDKENEVWWGLSAKYTF